MANSNQEVETPQAFVSSVEAYFGIKFAYDMAATEQSRKAPKFFTKEQDSLTMDWPGDGWCWLNPPYANLTHWVRKCVEQSRRGCKIVSIWPLSSDVNRIVAWEESKVTVIHGRIFSEVRSVMLCLWGVLSTHVQGAVWDRKAGTLTRRW